MTTRGDQITAAVDGAPQRVAIGTSGKVWASDGTDPAWTATTGAAVVVFDGNGTVPSANSKQDLSFPFACTITAWRVLADQSGSVVVGVWKDTYANYPPVVGDSIAGSEKPTLSSATKAEDTNLTTWTTAVAAGDTIRFNIDSISTCTRVTVILTFTRP